MRPQQKNSRCFRSAVAEQADPSRRVPGMQAGLRPGDALAPEHSQAQGFLREQRGKPVAPHVLPHPRAAPNPRQQLIVIFAYAIFSSNKALVTPASAVSKTGGLVHRPSSRAASCSRNATNGSLGKDDQRGFTEWRQDWRDKKSCG